VNAALCVDSLSKQYCLGSGSWGQYQTLREALVRAATAPWQWLRRRAGSGSQRPGGADVLWALRDVSFKVRPGEAVGIIGRNGAGKSTLLKVLSRVTEPTSGRAELRGRLGSLLEVGTGFHPELTGRENVFLSGAILGMTRREIVRKFDEIVAFAEVEPFLETPVKRYSSGMYVRLAFAVAAHLEPEILVVDEVLAVGDAAFQQKCIGRMQEAGREGRTILFVSHNLAALRSLCRRGIVLDCGRLVCDGPAAEALAHYLQSNEARATADLVERTDRSGAGRVRVHKIEIEGGGPGNPGQLVMGQSARFAFHLDRASRGVTCIATVYDAAGLALTRFNSALGHLDDEYGGEAALALVCAVEEVLLAPGRYRLDVALYAAGEMQDRIEAAAYFEVLRGAVRGREPPRTSEWKFFLPHKWSAEA
jgi:lipopolysaccharide transport system ATP-binding protein